VIENSLISSARKLIVHEAWDEPTSVNPQGGHGNASLHYEGRAAILSVSSRINDLISLSDNNPSLSKRLEGLAVCSDFPYVAVEKDRNLVHVAVTDEEIIHMNRKTVQLVNSKDKQAFEQALNKLSNTVYQ
jgi:hypothetical protein